MKPLEYTLRSPVSFLRVVSKSLSCFHIAYSHRFSRVPIYHKISCCLIRLASHFLFNTFWFVYIVFVVMLALSMDNLHPLHQNLLY